jgi:hypothetical protein
MSRTIKSLQKSNQLQDLSQRITWFCRIFKEQSLLYNSVYKKGYYIQPSSQCLVYARPPQWKLKAVCDCPFLQWKDEIANPCNFSAQEEEKLRLEGKRRLLQTQRQNWEKKTRTQSELSFWPNITFPSPRTAEVGSFTNAHYSICRKIIMLFRNFIKISIKF